MSNHKQLSYQVNAVNACIDHLQHNREFKLQAPTGSGKTFIISQIIDKYLENENLNFHPTTFLFIAPSTGGLDYQGYQKIKSYLEKNWVSGYDPIPISTSSIKSPTKPYLQNIDYLEEKKCYFIGWQMFKKGTKITEIDSEKNDIYQVIHNTKARNINIVLIIDEAHREVSSSKETNNIKQEILKLLDPYKIIKVSATLEDKDKDNYYEITYDEVREEAAIKQNVIISQLNNKVENIEQLDEDEQLIVSAIEKQKEIKKQYIKNKINMNPLILIQIPDNIVIDKDVKSEDQLLNKVNNILEKYGYKKGYNYAIWLDKLKTNSKKDILNEQSSLEILIFKTAIATGWDIPRANILVRIREAKVKAFNIQTLGRILRNPLFKYYGNELIDNAFVFTRDEKYKEYIKQESIVTDQEETKLVERSKRSKNSTFTINKVLIDDSNYDEQDLINHIVRKIINNKEFVKFFFYERNSILPGIVKIRSNEIFEENINREIYKQKEVQSKLNINNEPKITLFDLWVKYKTITKSNQLISKILDVISNYVCKVNKTIKEFYKACCHNWNKSVFVLNNNNTSLKEWIEYEKDQYLKEKFKDRTRTEAYVLPEKYKVSTKRFDISKWDDISSFNISLKLTSDNEKEFYKQWKTISPPEYIHLFRNGEVPTSDNYFVEYISSEGKKRRFFPDFIIIDEKHKNCLIIEAKGGDNKTDIDRESDNKLSSLKKSLERNYIRNKYNCQKIIKVSYKNDEVEYNEPGTQMLSLKEIREILGF